MSLNADLRPERETPLHRLHDRLMRSMKKARPLPAPEYRQVVQAGRTARLPRISICMLPGRAVSDSVLLLGGCVEGLARSAAGHANPFSRPAAPDPWGLDRPAAEPSTAWQLIVSAAGTAAVLLATALGEALIMDSRRGTAKPLLDDALLERLCSQDRSALCTPHWTFYSQSQDNMQETCNMPMNAPCRILIAWQQHYKAHRQRVLSGL